MRREQHRTDRDNRRHNGDEARRGSVTGGIGGGILRGRADDSGGQRGRADQGSIERARRSWDNRARREWRHNRDYRADGSGIHRGNGRASECQVDEARDDSSPLLDGGHRAGRRAPNVWRSRPYQ